MSLCNSFTSSLTIVYDITLFDIRPLYDGKTYTKRRLYMYMLFVVSPSYDDREYMKTLSCTFRFPTGQDSCHLFDSANVKLVHYKII